MYGSRTDFYEVTINDKFLGTYVLMEKNKRDKNRCNISKNLDDDISGGYIIKKLINRQMKDTHLLTLFHLNLIQENLMLVHLT